MSITKKEKIILFSESQKDELLEKLEKARLDYRITKETNLFAYGDHYCISIEGADLNKVV